jgi:hypothetical protein
MKKGVNKTAAFVAGALLISGFAAQAQENPFHIKNDLGETVHVLPPPAALHNPHEQPSDSHTTDLKITFTPTNHAALTDHGGSVISNVGVKNIFWNSTVANAAGTQGYAHVSDQMNAFVNSFSGSQDYGVITQYSKSGNPIATGIRNMGTFIDSKATQTSISDSSIQSYIGGLLTAGTVGAADTSAIYSVYFPSGMSVRSGSSKSCTSFCGYHGSFTWSGKTIKYAVYPWPCSNGCTTTGKGAGDMWTIVTSHEIREAVTDPVNAWWDGTTGYEADDKCAWQSLHQLAGSVFWVQPEFSNADGNKCVYYN